MKKKKGVNAVISINADLKKDGSVEFKSISLEGIEDKQNHSFSNLIQICNTQSTSCYL